MTHHARTEREALCATLLEVGPDAPTLCTPWSTADLAAHLVLRERRPDLAAGMVISALSGRTDRAMAAMVHDTPYPELVERVRTGPPSWHPTRLPAVDEAVNLVEMYVHHEDVRRAGAADQPRRLTREMGEALGVQLRRMAPLLVRRLHDVDVQVVTPTRRTSLGRGERPVVEVHGSPAEVLIFLTGRQAVAEVELVGDDAAVTALCDASLGL